MRHPRVKPEHASTFMHVYNRTVGSAGEFPFQDAEKEWFSTLCDRRVRYWVDGLVIGSELFVRNTMAKARVGCKVKKRRLVRALDHREQEQDLYCFKQLRLLLE